MSLERDAARAAGLKVYYTGEPCVHGHHAPRYVSTKGCSMCLRVAQDHARALLHNHRRFPPAPPPVSATVPPHAWVAAEDPGMLAAVAAALAAHRRAPHVAPAASDAGRHLVAAHPDDAALLERWFK